MAKAKKAVATKKTATAAVKVTAKATGALKKLRSAKGITQVELSEKTGIAQPYISLLESGKRAMGLKSAQKLSKALKCSVDALMK